MKKLIPILVIGLLFGLGGYKYYKYKNPDPVDNTATIDGGSLKLTETSAPTPAPTTETTTYTDVQVDKPVNGTLKGVVEVGASGFNSFVVNIDNQKNWELVSSQFGESLAYEGFATTEDVKAGLKKYIGDIFNKGVSGRNVHFVISSGALKNPKTELIAQAIQKDGWVVNRVTAQQEGKYALRALLPKAYLNNSFVVDMGSGNTKISWYSGSKLNTIECPGAKYYQNNTTDQDAYKAVSEAVMEVPAALRNNCFIIGGVPYNLAKQVRNNQERFTYLKNPDFYSGGEDIKLKSGINIYRALSEASGAKSFIFDWDANFTIGFLLTLN